MLSRLTTSQLLPVTTLLVLLFCAGTPAANPDSREQVAPDYDRLKTVSRDRGRVRVIARLPVEIRGPGRRDRIAAALGTLKSSMAQFSAAPLREFKLRPLAVYALTGPQLDAMIDSGLVSAVYEDRLNRPHLVESVPLVGGDTAQIFGLTGNGATVAIIDTGVDAAHIVFGSRVIAEACFSTRETRPWLINSDSLCPAGPNVEEQIGPGAAAPCDICDHGTHVASIAAGDHATWGGMAPQANVIAIQVFSRFSTEDVCGTGVTDCIAAYDSDVLRGLEHVESLATSHTIAAANLSLGSGRNEGLCDGSSSFTAPYADLWALDILVVASSGNDRYTNAVSSTSCVSTAIAVGSVRDTTDQVSAFSNSSTALDMLAPGEPIAAAQPNNGFTTMKGTSMAAPHVTGAFALLKGNDASLTATEMENILMTYSVPVLDSRNGLTFPRLDFTAPAGDINGDGKADVADLVLIQKALADQLTLSPLESVRLDTHPATGDGVIDLSDFLTLESILLAP